MEVARSSFQLVNENAAQGLPTPYGRTNLHIDTTVKPSVGVRDAQLQWSVAGSCIGE